MPRWNKARHHSPPPRREDLAPTDDPAAEHLKQPPDVESPIPSVVTTATDEPKKKRRNRGPLRLFRGGDSTRSHASSTPKSESPSKEIKPHHQRKHKGLKLFQRRNKRNHGQNKRPSTPVKAQVTTREEVTHTNQGEPLGIDSLLALSQSLSDDVDRPFYKDVCALPASLCCGVENAINCLGFPCFVAQQVMNDCAALMLGEKVQAEYKPKECTDDDPTLYDYENGMTLKLEDDEEEEGVQDVEQGLDDKIVHNETEGTMAESRQDDDDASIEGSQSADDDSTIDDESIDDDTSSDDDTSIEDDLLENDTSIDEPAGVHQHDKEQQVQNPSIEELVDEIPATKQDWAFQDDVPEDEVDDMTKQEEEIPFQEEGSLLENEKWAFLPEYATSTQELEQALQDEVEPERANKDRGDQETENKFEVFFSSEEWRRDLATEEQVREESVLAVPSYESREDAPDDEQEFKDCVIETFEKSRTAQPTMRVNPIKSTDHHIDNDVLEDPIMFVDNVQLL